MMNMGYKSKRSLLRPMLALSTAVFLSCVLWLTVSAGTPLGRAGYLDFSYNGFGSTTSPTGEKPESKLWWNDGFWWGSMFNSTTLKYHIYRLNWGEQVWEDTGVVLDDRPKSKADVLFVDDPVNPKLYVASHIYSGQANRIDNALSPNRARLYRFSYNRATQTYTPDDLDLADATKNYVVISSDEVEALTLGRDGTSGRLWVTFVSQERATPVTKNQVFINATTTAGNDSAWTGPLALSTPIGDATDVMGGDLSAVVVTSGKVAVVWNNSTISSTKNLLNVAYRAAGFTPSNANSGWSITQVPIPQGLDDHINLKSLQANGTGQIFVALKTNAPQSGDSLPHVQMVAIDVSAVVTYTIRNYSDNLAKDTRPIVVLDEGSNPASVSDDTVYLFVAGSDSGSKICYGYMAVKLPISTLPSKFTAPTAKTPDKAVDDCGVSFIEDSLTGYKNMNNATSMKGSANSTTGIVVLASDNTTYITAPVPSKVYAHNVMGNPPPVVTARGPNFNASGVAPTAPVTATFSKPMSVTTISGTTFKVSGALGAVAGTVSYNPGSRTATFLPAAPLQANTTYTVELTNAIKDTSNLALGGNFRNPNAFPAPIAERWKFTTGAAAVSFALASYSALETAPTASITVTLDTTSTQPVSVTYGTISGGTATTSDDYTSTTGVLVFPANVRVQAFIVPLKDDLVQDGNRTVNLALSLPSGTYLGPQATAQLIIIDNEGPPSVQFSTLLPVLENAGSVNIQATLSHSTTTPVTVDYVVANGGTATDSTDYSVTPGTLSFPANTTVASFALAVTDDSKDEADETVILQLTNQTPPTITLGTPGYTTTLTILDNDLPPGVKFSSATDTADEAAGVKTVTVELTGESGLPVSVVYATSNISATAGEDYNAASDTVIFNPGETSKTIEVTVIDDNLDEEDEPFDVALLDATNATLAVPFNTAVSISDDDAEPSISFATTSFAKVESGGTAVVTVNLSTASGRRVVVDYTATSGTASEGQDFDVTQGQLIFAPGETSQSFEVPLFDDSAAEGNETVNLVLNNAAGATISSGGNAILTINDNDGAPTVSFSSATYSVNENGGSVSVVVNLNVVVNSPVTVDLAVVGGTATVVSDYSLAPGKLTFSPGETTKNIVVTIVNDSAVEGSETVLFKLNNVTNAALGTADATLTIVDDEPTPQTSTLAVTKTGSGTGKVTSAPAGIDCGSTCSASFTNGTAVTLTATPDASMRFAGWSGACSGSTTTCQVTIDAAKTATAAFEPVQTNTQLKLYLPVVRK